MLIKPDAVDKAGQIIHAISEHGKLHVVAARLARMSKNDAADFYSEHAGRDFFNPLCEFMSSGCVLALEVVGLNAVREVRMMLGPTDSSVARTEAPQSIRARWGTDGRRNACHGSDSVSAGAREIEFFFKSKRGQDHHLSGAGEPDNTLCLIKPHVINGGTRMGGDVGAIMSAITDGGYRIRSLQTFSLGHVQAEEFLEVYKGVVGECKCAFYARLHLQIQSLFSMC